MYELVFCFVLFCCCFFFNLENVRKRTEINEEKDQCSSSVDLNKNLFLICKKFEFNISRFKRKHLASLSFNQTQTFAVTMFGSIFESNNKFRFISLAYRNSWTLDTSVGRSILDAGLWMLDLDAGLWTLDAGRYIQEARLWALDAVVDWFRTKS